MPPLEFAFGVLLLSALALYFVLGGADFGGGVWDLLASGPRKKAQRAAIAHAIGPVWEANHVWLIFAVVVLFSAFPTAFAAISISLHVPLTLFLIGVVFRGSAFAFRSLAAGADRVQLRWGLVFSWASTLAPFLLGMCVAAIASGGLRAEGTVAAAGFFRPWLTPFAFLCGALAVALCAQLAATFLAYEVKEAALADDFRRRAILSGIAVAALALLSLWVSRDGAPLLFAGVVGRRSGWALHALTAGCGALALWMLHRRRFGVARVLVVAQVVGVLAGWAGSQYPYLVVPDLTVWSAAARPATLKVLAVAVAIGAPILAPSLYLLFWLFKSRRGPMFQR
jgi:cytochrome bd ubiquinol oxidase subunit II